tara:strand:+ start:2959 stop:3426 length:468 start_codon:yes stop_codon:yes gene_type:complete
LEKVQLNVNGFPQVVLVGSHETILETLRNRLNLTGTKQCCDEGTCGSCTVLMDGKPVLGCLTPTVRCVGKEILTIEGVSSGDNLHPVQKQLVQNGGMQCGFCTPGVVMTAIPYLKENPDPSIDDIKEGLSGNLCRCTGYKKIIEAVKNAAEELNG